MRGLFGCAAAAALFLGYSGTAFAGASTAAEQAEEAARQQQLQQLAEQHKEPPKSYWYVEAGPAYFDMDAVNGLGAAIDDVAFVFIRQPDSGFDFSSLGVKGAVGVVQPIKDTDKRIIARVDAAHVKDDDNLSVTLTGGEFLDILPIDGTVSPGEIASAGASGTASGSVDGRFYRVGALMGVGKAFDNDKRHALVGIGLYGTLGQLKIESRMDAVLRGVIPAGFISLDEKSKIWAVGPVLMGEVALPVSDHVAFTLGGRVGGLYSSGRLSAVQSAKSLGGTPFSYSAGDKDSGFAYMGELKAGFDFKVSDSVTLSLFGSGEGRNDYYKIKNPRSGPGLDANNAASYHPGPARLDQDVQFIASVGAAAKIAF